MVVPDRARTYFGRSRLRTTLQLLAHRDRLGPVTRFRLRVAAGLLALLGAIGSLGIGLLDARPASGQTTTTSRSTRTITLDKLPREAIVTLVLIKRGGPYPYRRDGITFENRERKLPEKSRGYYREYTVKTPGESDRGPRRIVAGRSGERYYTPDHYRTFYRIVSRS